MTTVTVIMPAYNEGMELGANFLALSEQFAHYPCYDVQYIIVDDGSTDETAQVAQNFERYRKSVQVVTHEQNLGLGAALRSGVARATGEYVLVMDADLSYSPAVGMELIESLERDAEADIALASAYMRGGRVKNVPLLRRILSREANRLLSLAANGRYATFTCMVRAYRKSFLERTDFHCDGMDANAEILLAAIRAGAKILEIPACLEWDDARIASRGFPNLLKVTQRIWSTMRLAFAHRPTLWFAVPGLIPGLLPLVVTILLAMHVGARSFALWTAATVFIQYTSLAIFAGQLGTFFASVFSRTRKVQARRA